MSDCVKCSYPRGEPKGERVCKKCARQEGTPKGRATGTHLSGVGDTGTVATLTFVPAILTPDADQKPEEQLPQPFVGGPNLALGEINLNVTGPFVAMPPGHQPLLPAHSKMGGSAAHRFLNCPGSTALIAQLKLDDTDDDPDYRRDGTQAHELGARALETGVDAWELVHEYPQLDPMGAAAVQEYIDYVRSRPGRRRVEVKLHLPELSPYMFSTIDAELVPVTGEVALEIVDYKHGIGIYVGVKDNAQLKYYACMVIMEDPTYYDDAGIVELTIAQPRITWAEPIRTWRTTVGELKRWLYDVLLPAMAVEAKDMHLQMGEWCRFCPAKLVCPAMSQAFAAFSGATSDLETMSSEVLGRDYVLSTSVQMRINAIKLEVKRRLMDRVEVPGAKLVSHSADRVFKDGVVDSAIVLFGKDAFTEPKLLSPPQMEKLPNGKAFVAEWAYFPEAGYVVALATDPKKAVVPKTPEEKYGDPAKYLDAPAES